MAMLSQSLPVEILGCPAGVCRGVQPEPRTRWKAVAAGFAGGAFVMSLAAALLGAGRAPSAQLPVSDREAAAVHWQAYVQSQTPREIPREWRYQINGVDTSRMFRKQR
jgi:hypothetical protein